MFFSILIRATASFDRNVIQRERGYCQIVAPEFTTIESEHANRLQLKRRLRRALAPHRIKQRNNPELVTPKIFDQPLYGMTYNEIRMLVI
jgi:hypothetical protein